MADDSKLQNLQKALQQQLGGDPLDGLKPNLESLSQDGSNPQLKMKLGQNSFGDATNKKNSFKDHKGVNKQVLKGNAKAKK